jgi:iron-sulfur cluster repair protein YtfE (RIC family)
MAMTDKYRDQHQELLGVVGEIQKLLNPGTLAAHSDAARKALSTLAGKLNIHLAMEDSVLYPSLLKHKDPSVQAKAKQFMDEMGGIKQAFGAYLAKWPTASSIQQNPADFVKETQALFQVLGKRIQAEDSDLYALADRVG